MAQPVLPQAEILYEKAKEAYKRHNYDYAITLLFSALDISENYTQARNLLRNAELKRYEESLSIIKKVFNAIPNLLNFTKGTVYMKKQRWMDAISLFEKILHNNPKSRNTLSQIAVCFEALNMDESAKDSLEFLRHIHAGDVKALKQLGRLALKEENLDKARMYFEEVLRYAPIDTDAQKGLKDIAAMKTIKKGGWEDTSSYRDKIKDEDKADIFEKEHRSVQSEEDVKKIIEDRKKELEKSPNNISIIKSIAEMYLKIKDYEHAKEFYSIAIEKNPSDASLKELLHDVVISEYDKDLRQAKEELDKDPSVQKKIDALQKEKEEFILSSTEALVEQYPNNLPLRYKLGGLYYDLGKTNKAIQQFQYVIKDPHRRLQAYNYMGLCFLSEKKYDIAVKQLQKALEDTKEMDSFTKEITYNLGSVYEKMGDHDKALLEFKKIYEVDIAFRDVAEKIEKAYG